MIKPTQDQVFLGISAFYHDSAAALVRDGVILAAAQEERFSRRKNDERFPTLAIQHCLRTAQLGLGDVDSVIFHEKPIVKFSRSLETFLTIAPRGFRTFMDVVPLWLSERLDVRRTFREHLHGLGPDIPILATSHHQAHAASAFFPSPFSQAAILTIDGVGEWTTTLISKGDEHGITPLFELKFPHSIGLLYSAFTTYCGFKVNSGEYKLMGLAPYGEPRYESLIRDHLVDLKKDGSLFLNLKYFDFLAGERMTNDRFHSLFGGLPRTPESPLEQRHMDLAKSIQVVTEDVVLTLARHAKALTGMNSLCLAGGVALNCVANGRLLREGPFENLWIQPASGDAGTALGAAYSAWFESQKNSADLSSSLAVKPHVRVDRMQGSFLGPEFSDEEILTYLRLHNAVYQRLELRDLVSHVAQLLADGFVVGWFQGRMEFGPRALGNRSILADPRRSEMQSKLNLKIKFRESFRPFAPVVKADRVHEFFDLHQESPYMLLVAGVASQVRCQIPVHDEGSGFDRLRQNRSKLPAVTHVDYSARIQTVSPETNGLLYELLDSFEQITNVPVLVNTSFNVRGEPVVGHPDDAYRCLVNTEMDWLAIGNFLLKRADQPHNSLPVTHPNTGD